MERLTKRDKDGTAIAPEFADETYLMQDDHDRFTGYINSPIVERLAELEDKIESGQLVELTCKVGDTVYVLRSGAGSPLRIEEEKIIGFDILQNAIMAHGKYGHAYSEVFLTKLEAEARLKELQK